MYFPGNRIVNMQMSQVPSTFNYKCNIAIRSSLLHISIGLSFIYKLPRRTTTDIHTQYIRDIDFLSAKLHTVFEEQVKWVKRTICFYYYIYSIGTIITNKTASPHNNFNVFNIRTIFLELYFSLYFVFICLIYGIYS